LLRASSCSDGRFSFINANSAPKAFGAKVVTMPLFAG
jgi:hypothetical protein